MSKLMRTLIVACLLSVFACAAWLACNFAVNGAEIFVNTRAHSAQVRSGPLFLSAQEGQLTVSIEGADGWTYGDGEKEVVVSPLAEGEKPSYFYTGETAGGTLYESAEQPADAGCYTLTVTLAGEDGTIAEGTCSFTIQRKPLNVEFENVSFYTYTGDPVYPQFSDDRVAGDELEFSLSAENVFEAPCDPVDVGTGYRATAQLAGGADASNYIFDGAESGQYSVGPAELTVRIDEEVEAEYTGGPIDIEEAANARAVAVSEKDKPDWEFSLEPFPSDPFSPQPEPIAELRERGSYTVYWHVSAQNHTAKTGEISFTILRAENSFLLDYARESWHYGESAGQETIPAPKFGGQTMQMRFFTAAGEPYTEKFGSLTPAGQYYALVTVDGTENYTALSEKFYFTVERASLTLRADGNAVYGDGAEEIGYSFSASGLKNGETLEGLLSAAELQLLPRALSASGAEYTAGSSAGEYTVHLGGSFAADALANYTVQFEAGTLFVDSFSLTASLQPAFDSEIYDGTQKEYTASLSAGAFGEEVKALVSYADEEGALPGAPTNAGNYTVTLSLSAEDAVNYALDGETCAQFEVLPRTLGVDQDGIVLSIEWTEVRSYVYDGTDKTSLVQAQFSPFGGGKAALIVSPAAEQGAFRDVREGGYLFEVVGFADESLARNYALPEEPLRETFFIRPREVYIAVPGGSALFSDAIPALGWEYAGASAYLEEARFLPEDGIRFSVATDAGQGSPAGEYAAYISACTGGQSRLFNYSINGGAGYGSARGTFTVLPAPIDTSGTAGFSTVYDGRDHLFAEEASLSAVVRGGREGCVRWQFFIDGGAESGVFYKADGVRGAGTYTVRYTVTADNHSPAQGTFTVNVAPASNGWVSVPADVGWTYGEGADLASLFGQAEFGQVRAEYYASRSGAGTAGDPYVYGGAMSVSDFGAHTPAGTYYVRLIAEGTADYAGLEGSAVISVKQSSLPLPSFAGGERTAFSVYGERWEDGFGCDVIGIFGYDPSLMSVSCTGGSLRLAGGEWAFLSSGAGAHALTFSLTDENYCWRGAEENDVALSWEVSPALYDLSGVGYAEVYECVYDGQAHLPALALLPQGKDGVPVTVRYEGGGTGAGEWAVCAVLTSASPNYIFAGGEARLFTRVRILPRPLEGRIEVPAAVYGDAPAAEVEVYGLAAEDSFAEDILPFLRMTYSGVSNGGEMFDAPSPEGLSAGSYTVRAYVQGCNYAFDLSAPYPVARIQLRADSFSLSEVCYDGALHSAAVQCEDPAYAGLYALSSEEGSSAGEYAASVRLVDPDNYCWQGGEQVLSFTWIIARAEGEDVSVSPLTAADIVVTAWGEGAGGVCVTNLPTFACAGGEPLPAEGVEWSADGIHYFRTAPTQAGRYFVRAYVSESADHAAAVSAPLAFEIGAGVYDASALSLSDASFVYDGTFRTLTPAGALPVGADGISVTCTVTGGRADAGSAEVRVVFTAHSPNYTFAGGLRTLELTARLTVLPRPVQVVWVLPEGGFTYNGEVQHTAASPSIRAYYADVNGQEVSLPVGESADGVFRDWREGGYLFAVACADANYAPEGGQMRVQIARAPITVAAEDKQALFGGEEVPLSYTVEGELFGQEIAVSLSREAGRDAGEYAISLLVEGAENFEVNAVGGVYAVLPAPSSLHAEMEGWTYGEEAKAPIVSGAAGELSFRYIGTSNGGEVWDGALPPTEAGSYELIVSDAGSANVQGGSVRLSFTIARDFLSAPALGGGRTLSESYGGGVDSVLIEGFDPAAMFLSGASVRAGEDGIYLVAEGMGTYTARVRLSDADNYAWDGGEEVVLVWRLDSASEEDAWLIGVAATFSLAGAGALAGAFLFGKSRGRRKF